MEINAVENLSFYVWGKFKCNYCEICCEFFADSFNLMLDAMLRRGCMRVIDIIFN